MPTEDRPTSAQDLTGEVPRSLFAEANQLKEIKRLAQEGQKAEAARLYGQAFHVDAIAAAQAIEILLSGKSVVLGGASMGTLAPQVLQMPDLSAFEMPASFLGGIENGDSILGRYFGFDQADLDANRRGVLSDRQIRLLTKGDPGNWKIALILAGVGIIPAFILFFSAEGNQPILLIGVSWALCCILLSLFMIAPTRLFQTSLRRAEGLLAVVHQRSIQDGTTNHYDELQLDGQSYSRAAAVVAGVEFSLASAIQPGARYAIYYVKSRGFLSSEREVMSLERLG